MINPQKLLVPLLMTGTLLYSTASLANTRPIAEKQAVIVTEDNSEIITLVASDADGDTLTYKIVRKPRRGTLSKESEGIYTYTPRANFNGKDRFLFRVSDGTTSSRLATVKIMVTDENDALTASDINVNTEENRSTRLRLQGKGNSRRLTYTISKSAEHGTTRLRGNRVTYQPQENYNGSDHFEYTVSEGGNTAIATVTIAIASVNNAPSAKNMTVSVIKDSIKDIALLGLDVDANDIDTLGYNIIRYPRNGALSLPSGADISYTPNTGYKGADNFSYRVTDSAGLSSRIATVKLIIAESDNQFTSEPNPTGKLNDTGITQCGDYAYGNSESHQNNLDCQIATDNEGDPIPTEQDAISGRDITKNDDSNGHAGFSFLKIAADGTALPHEARNWHCVKDSVTGLVWEVKKGTPDNVIGNHGLHDADDRYTWYEPDATKNGGAQPANNSQTNAICYGDNTTDFCNTKAYVDRVNAQGWCGSNDWRLPTKEELQGLVDYSVKYPSPMIDSTYFPNAKGNNTWSSSPYAGNTNLAWTLSFFYGGIRGSYKNYNSSVRLVRSGQ